jgi:hypothetical protein
MGNQDNHEREGNLGQPGRDSDKPAGTSGRQGNTGTESWQQGHPDAIRRPKRDDDDEDSGLGNRISQR